jgi:hypothetical protein
MSDIEGAFDAVVPVAAHMPDGGFTFMSLPVAVRILVDTVEVFVDVRSRVLVDGDSAAAFGLRMPSGCGNGTGVAVLPFEDAMLLVFLPQERPRRPWKLRSVLSVRGSTCQPRVADCWFNWQWRGALAGSLFFVDFITWDDICFFQ